MPRANTHEVELRVVMREEQEKILLKKLEKADFRGEEEISDIYFCPKHFASLEELEMQEVGSYSLRLRRSKKEDKEEKTLNVKIITAEGDHHAWEERETTIGSISKMQQALEAIGFKEVFRIEKKRRTYCLDGMNILLEEIKDFGPALEIEILTTEDKREEAKEKILAFLNSVG
ncbi:MAG: CYTH domain-containing protein, partial [Methanobacteriota archaeon]